MHTNNVSFKAIPIMDAAIPVKKAGKWVQEEVKFIRFNPYLKSDMAALKGVEKVWNNQNMSGAIREEAQIAKSPVYALCTKNVDVKKVNPWTVLGLFTTDKIDKATDAVEIYKLGVTPEAAYAQNNRHRSIKHIGSTMIKKFVEFLDQKTNVQTLTIGSEPESVKFYQRMHIPERENSVHVFELNKDQFQNFLE